MRRYVSKEPESEPHAAKHVTMLVYGKNSRPIVTRKFLEPNFGTNHSDVLSRSMETVGQSMFLT